MFKSVFFSSIVYNPKASDNEERSANMFHDFCQECLKVSYCSDLIYFLYIDSIVGYNSMVIEPFFSRVYTGIVLLINDFHITLAIFCCCIFVVVLSCPLKMMLIQISLMHTY